MAAHGADGLEPNDRVIHLPLQRHVYRILQICLAADGIAARINCNVLHAVDFVRRHLRSPLQPVVERDARQDLPGIVEVQAVTIDQRSVREGLGPGQVEVIYASDKELCSRPEKAQSSGVRSIPVAVLAARKPCRPVGRGGRAHLQSTGFGELVNHFRQARNHLVVTDVVVPPVDRAAAELHIVGALHPVEGVAVRPVVSVPDTASGVLGVHVHGAHAVEMGVGELDSRRHAGERVRHSLPLPEPPVEEVARVKLIGQIGPEGAGQAGDRITRKVRIARNSAWNAELVTRQQPSDIDLVGARQYIIKNSIGKKQLPLVAKVVIHTQRTVVCPLWERQGGTETLKVQGVARRIAFMVGKGHEFVPHRGHNRANTYVARVTGGRTAHCRRDHRTD